MASNQPDCIFCKMVAGELPSHQVWESDTHLAFLSIFPNMKGVTVVIPKEHLGSYIFEQDDQAIAEQMVASKQVAQILDSYFEIDRCGVVFEGFGVDHLHTKLYPLHGTGDLTEWKKIESTNNNQYFERYPGYISSNDSHRADDDELATLAAKIKASRG